MIKRRVLLMQPLADLQHPTQPLRQADNQPDHPHLGIHLARSLKTSGFEVVFANQLPWRLPLPARLRQVPRFQVVNARLQLRSFDAVLTYAEGGVKFIMGSFLTQGTPKVIPVLLTTQRPRRSALTRCASNLMYRFALRRADAVIFCLSESKRFCAKLRKSEANLFYAPTTVDSGFYAPDLIVADDRPGVVPANAGFILAAGDSSRDDRLLYEACRELEAPVIRVTRDPEVRRRAEQLMVARRGDVILENVSFKQLRWLYGNCSAAVLTSTLDLWQAAGSTALTEAFACGAPSMVTSLLR